jgi:hypothetical protein
MMYAALPAFVLGFHGCDKTIAEKVVSGKERLKQSKNDYDWLGNGIYFWENSPARALEYAKLLHSNPTRAKTPIKEPAVIGAVIDLGNCLNLLDAHAIQIVKDSYRLFRETVQKAGFDMPENKKAKDSEELLVRYLDCAVMQLVDEAARRKKIPKYDAIRAAFLEGEEIYPTAGFREKTHIQICVRNPNCIKGYFLPIDRDDSFDIP